jgi:hypothetical protein
VPGFLIGFLNPNIGGQFGALFARTAREYWGLLFRFVRKAVIA